ncbi:uncharacterized protein DUF946 [Collimonas sp. PA-H2]|uniref:Vps62-related protein n=1 Tax=Collimonas sp. PA-H2 TaxID=1881062 RepID=UPI000BF291AE|nr:Vps62-related protein [Collimonas sp. PA-H2]PFH08507.1 uncharacterized protein DUF946 [Collimonas sp. PA-H2]
MSAYEKQYLLAPQESLTETSQLVFQDLAMDFTTQFVQTWNDQGSGAHEDASTWRPLASDAQVGFYSVGDVLFGNYDDPNGKHVGLLVKSLSDPGVGQPALMPPTGFQYVWSSQVYMLMAPDGYVALGGVAAWDSGSLSPDNYRCVRADLVIPALVGDQVYNDSGSGKNDDLSCWNILPPSAPAGNVAFSPGTFIAIPSYDTPGPIGFNALQIPFTDVPPSEYAKPPVLSSKNPPQDGETVSYIVKMPWFAVSDPSMSDPERILKSPVYTMVRSDKYKLSMFKNNTTGTLQTQSYTWLEGVSKESVESFAHSVGIELGMEYGSDAIGFKVSAKLSYNFTYTTSSSSGMQEQKSMNDMLNVLPHCAAAAYYLDSTYDIYRQDGKRIQTVTPDFGVPSSTYDTQFPDSLSKVKRR